MTIDLKNTGWKDRPTDRPTDRGRSHAAVASILAVNISQTDS